MGKCLSTPSEPATHDLRGNMMRERVDQDIFEMYEIVKKLGEGSMGSVCSVKKKTKSFKVTSKDRKGSTDYDAENSSLRTLQLRDNKINQSMEKIVLQEERRTSSTDGKDPEIKSDVSFDLKGAMQTPRRRSSGGQTLYALKAIQLSRMSDEFVEELKNEIDILKSLDHPNIVKPIETFNRKRQLFVVMECCTGGDLYSRDPYSEEEAASIAGKLLSAIAYLHSRNITHRDLKFENIMFESSSPTAEIKVIDFGLSKKYLPEAPRMMEGVGTIYTMAPQVLQGLYTSQADLWSVGVIVYMLLCGEMPFAGRKRRHVIDKIMRCDYNFNKVRFKNVSDEAKKFCSELITVDPKVRLNAEEALGHTWITSLNDVEERRPSSQVMEGVTDSLKKFGNYGNFQKLALMVIAHQSNTEEIFQLRKAFDQYDTHNNGTITYDEFKEAITKVRPQETEDAIFDAFKSVDIDGSGLIHYTEFLAATLEAQGHIEEERLAEAFDRLDSDDSGFITKQNLKDILGTSYSKESVDKLVQEVDIEKNGKISFEEFVALFRVKHGNIKKEMDTMMPHAESMSSEAEDDRSKLVDETYEIPL